MGFVFSNVDLFFSDICVMFYLISVGEIGAIKAMASSTRFVGKYGRIIG